MSRDGSGNYTLPLPDVITGTTIESSWANTTLSDIETEMTDSLSRSGVGGMLAVLKLINGAEATPALTWSSDADCGLYRAAADDVRMSVGGTGQMRWTATGVQVWEDATWKSLITYPSGASDNETLRYDIASGDWVANTNVTATAAGDVSVAGDITLGDAATANFQPTLTFDLGETTEPALYANVGYTGLEMGSGQTQLKIEASGTERFSVNSSGDAYVDRHLSVNNNVTFTSLITSEPLTAGQLWDDNGVVRISSGSAEDGILRTELWGNGWRIKDDTVNAQTFMGGGSAGTEASITVYSSDYGPSPATFALTSDDIQITTRTGEVSLSGIATTFPSINGRVWDDNGILRRRESGHSAYDTQDVIFQKTGSFTPTIQDISGSDGEGQTYSLQYGHYVKQGPLVFVTITVTTTSLGTLSGGLRIAGLPYTSSSTAGKGRANFICHADNMSLPADQSIYAVLAGGTNYANLFLGSGGAGSTEATPTETTGTLTIEMSGTYITDSVS